MTLRLHIYIYQEYTKTYIPKSKQKHSKTFQALSPLLVLVVIIIIILVLTLAGFTSLECNDGLAEHDRAWATHSSGFGYELLSELRY